jgi:dGTPase
MPTAVKEASDTLRAFLFERVYRAEWAKREEVIADRLIESLYHRAVESPELMPLEYTRRAETEGVARSACDFIACMTDGFAVRLFEQQFLPAPMDDGL